MFVIVETNYVLDSQKMLLGCAENNVTILDSKQIELNGKIS